MRSRITSALVALMAVLALGAVAASAASAHEYFIEGKSMKTLGLKEEAISAIPGSATTLSYPGIETVCNSTNVSGTIRQGGSGTATFGLSECAVTLPRSGCSVEQPIAFQADSGLVEVEGKLADEFTPKEPIEGGIFTWLQYLGGCYGSHAIAGEFTGLVKSEVEQETGTFTFSSSSGSELEQMALKLKVGVKLSGANAGKKWSARK